jgi:fructose-1,6-bisphosphatase/inositol monophosphatase family enzyme
LKTSARDFQRLRELLCDLQDSIRDGVARARRGASTEALAAVHAVTAADTIYRIDKVSETVIERWFARHWPREWPVEVVMEGVSEQRPLTFPERTDVKRTRWKCILDPIDGTRGLMYDKRAAWALGAVAPQKGPRTSLSDVVVAAMTEIPASKQWRADQISAVKGCGRAGVVAESVDARSGRRSPLKIGPSRARNFKHGFAAISRFFPEGKSLLARLEEELWDKLYGLGREASPLVFDDQYISTGGQFCELLAGHDRMLGDLRPLAFKKLGYGNALTSHPYDVCAALVATEAGVVIESPDGSPLDAPLDTTSAVAWMGYANETLARQVRPILRRLLKKYFG